MRGGWRKQARGGIGGRKEEAREEGEGGRRKRRRRRRRERGNNIAPFAEERGRERESRARGPRAESSHGRHADP
eukprot:546394-Hanusia_phi.AAC.2